MPTISNPTPLQPERNPNRRFTEWLRAEVYTGPQGTGSYVPNKYDHVWDRNNGMFEVAEVDINTGLSVLVPINLCKTGMGATEEDALLSIGPGAASEAFVLIVDTSIIPHVANFDHRFFIPGSEAGYVKIFKGAEIQSGSEVISAMFNGAGQMTSENIPLEAFYHGTALKRPRSGFVTQALSAGELVSVVVYNADGSRSSVYRLVVALSNTYRDLNAEWSYVTGIELISDFLSATDANLIEIPQNMNLDATLIRGRVHFMGQASTTFPIDGSKFDLHGMGAFIPSVPNQVGDLVLTYKLGNNENAYGATEDGVITRPYRIKTINADLRYTFKLFAVPVWISNTARWSMKWYLYNLDRVAMYDVTDKVIVSPGSSAYDGNPNNHALQTVQLSVNWSQVAVGNAYQHFSQTFKIRNNARANEPLSHGGDPLTRSYVTIVYSDELEAYNTALSAKVYPKPGQVNKTNLSISNGYLDLGEWLDAHYYALLPLQINSTEYNPPTPTHVRLSCGNFYRVIGLNEVLQPIEEINVPLSPTPQGKTLQLEFVQQNGLEEMELAMGYLTLEHVVSLN